MSILVLQGIFSRQFVIAVYRWSSEYNEPDLSPFWKVLLAGQPRDSDRDLGDTGLLFQQAMWPALPDDITLQDVIKDRSSLPDQAPSQTTVVTHLISECAPLTYVNLF